MKLVQAVVSKMISKNLKFNLLFKNLLKFGRNFFFTNIIEMFELYRLNRKISTLEAPDNIKFAFNAHLLINAFLAISNILNKI